MGRLLDLVFLPALTAAIVTYLASPVVISLSEKLGIIDDPRKRKHPGRIHTYPVSRGGGVAIFAGALVAALAFLPLDKHLFAILAGGIIIVALGILDDIYDLNPYFRLLMQFITALLPIAAGIGISFLTNPFNGIVDLSQPQLQISLLGKQGSVWILSDSFALLWIVFLMNILNMGAKGVDGQLPGVVAIAATTIAFLSLKFSADITQWPVIILAAMVSGSYLGFLPWNYFPQKIMPGFSGSNLAGYLLAILSILSTTKVGTLLVVLGVPLVDTGYTILRRIAAGKSPVWGDKEHLHHKLLDAGFDKKQVAWFYWAATALLGIIALNLNAQSKFYTIVGISVAVGGLLLWLTYRPKA